ncbi:MAG: ABC transporter permease [Nocardioidaceae bacterium]|nr:ABC transporter permease [Nocardioidaceae bacterium]
MTASLRQAGQFLLAVLLVGLAWQLVSGLGLVKVYVLPPPLDVLRAFADNRPTITHHALVTLWTSLAGLALGTVLAALAALGMAYSGLLHRAFRPLVVMLSACPIIGVIPILVVAFGDGYGPRVAVAAVASFIVTALYLVNGLSRTDALADELMHSLNASAWQRLRMVQSFSAVPYLMAALKLSVSTCVIQAIVAEWISGTSGLGYLVQFAGYSFRIDVMWAAVLTAVVITLGLLGILALVESLVFPWAVAEGRSL